ncbi:hypothetical protein C3L33_04872, partial [Rhododendron williamsianum]
MDKESKYAYKFPGEMITVVDCLHPKKHKNATRHRHSNATMSQYLEDTKNDVLVKAEKLEKDGWEAT